MKKLGLTLGGGGSRCFAHLGMFEELIKNKIPLDYIVASSTGSIIATLVANNVEIESIKKEFYKLSTRLKWFIPGGFFTFNQKVIRDMLNNLLDNKQIEKSKIPITIIGTNLNNGNEVLFEKGDIIKAVCASSAQPLVYRPIKYGSRYISDGSIIDSIPADICREKVGKNNIVLASSLDGPLDTEVKRFDKFHTMFRAIYIPLLHFRKIIVHQNSDIILEPLKDIKFNFHNWKHLLNFGDITLMEHYFNRGKNEAKLKMNLIKKLVNEKTN